MPRIAPAVAAGEFSIRRRVGVAQSRRAQSRTHRSVPAGGLQVAPQASGADRPTGLRFDRRTWLREVGQNEWLCTAKFFEHPWLRKLLQCRMPTGNSLASSSNILFPFGSLGRRRRTNNRLNGLDGGSTSACEAAPERIAEIGDERLLRT
jgi:hypothetical protein